MKPAPPKETSLCQLLQRHGFSSAWELNWSQLAVPTGQGWRERDFLKSIETLNRFLQSFLHPCSTKASKIRKMAMFYQREDLARSSALPLESPQKGRRKLHRKLREANTAFCSEHASPRRRVWGFSENASSKSSKPCDFSGVCPSCWHLAAGCTRSTLQRGVRPGWAVIPAESRQPRGEDGGSEHAGSPHEMSALLVCSLFGRQPFG